MVASTSSSTTLSLDTKDAVKQNGAVSTNGTKTINDNFTTVPKGKYTLVGIDIDTTGRRLIDEIIQLAAFTPNESFGQYVMPYMNLNPAARQRHQVRVISIGFYRMLKSTQTYKIIKSKSEIATLKDFLNWLEDLKAKDTSSQGVILVYHEERKFIPYMILEAVKKYNMLDRFQNIVKSFVNGLHLAKTKTDKVLKHYTLSKLSKHLKNNINFDKIQQNNIFKTSATMSTEKPSEDKKKWQYNNEREFDGNARVRAKLSYNIALYLSNQDTNESLDAKNASDKMLTALQQYAQPIKCDLDELHFQNEMLERQNSFRPVFLNYFKSALYHRMRAVKFRIILAEHNYDLKSLNDIWLQNKRDGLVQILQDIEELKSEEKTELADLFDSHFDPRKTTMKPVAKFNFNRRRNRRAHNTVKKNVENTAGNEQDAGGDNQQPSGTLAINPDSTTKSPKHQRGRRHPRSYNNKNLSNNQSLTNPVNNVIQNASVPTNQ